MLISGLDSAATTLTSWHLLVTFCSLHVALWMKLFEHKPFDARAVMGFGILNGISIGLLNLSLGFNSVGFYQVKFYFPVIILLNHMQVMSKFWLIPTKFIQNDSLYLQCTGIWNLLVVSTMYMQFKA